MEECVECLDDNATWITPGGYAICYKCIKKEREENENTTK